MGTVRDILYCHLTPSMGLSSGNVYKMIILNFIDSTCIEKKKRVLFNRNLVELDANKFS